MDASFHVGQRLSYEGHLCTVRYIGEVKGTKGKWLGVEWDDATRGKHDGTHDSTIYFRCLSRQPKAASFIRPTRKHDLPRSFTEALKSKYVADLTKAQRGQDDGQRGWEEGGREGGGVIKISGKVAEEIGFDKIRTRLADLEELRIVILDGLQVHRPLPGLYRRAWEAWSQRDPQTSPLQFAGRHLDIGRTCPQTTELDVSRNLFESWLEIASICEELSQLRSLRCDGNRFIDVEMSQQEQSYFATAFHQVCSLSLSETMLSWAELAAVARCFTGIATLVASGNQLQQVDNSLLPQNITTLTLENNDFSSLADLSAVKALPSLHKINLRNNNISTIARPSSPVPVFQPSLREIDLSYNAVSSWSFINSLPAALPGLASLRVSSNPLYDTLLSPTGARLAADDGYTLTIARLPSLATLNYSAVSAKDRLNAETYYLSQIALELSLLPGSSSERDVLDRHPLWKQLCDEYGTPRVTRGSATGADPDALSARLLKLRLRIGASAWPHAKLEHSSLDTDGPGSQGGEHVGGGGVISLPKRYSVYTVQGLVGRHLGLDPPRVRLIWETGKPEVVASREETSLEPWDSDVEELAEQTDGKVKMLEVELVPGTRPIGTWVDGDDVAIRVELARGLEAR